MFTQLTHGVPDKEIAKPPDCFSTIRGLSF
jgi:hypothetical protein